MILLQYFKNENYYVQTIEKNDEFSSVFITKDYYDNCFIDYHCKLIFDNDICIIHQIIIKSI